MRRSIKNQIFILLFLFLTLDQVKGQNDCIVNQLKFSEYLYRNFNIHPLRSASKNKYIAYSIQFTIHEGKIAGFVYSPETPENVIIRNDITLRGINSKMKELGVEFLNDRLIFVPVLYIWNHPEKDIDNLEVVTKHLTPENSDSKLYCILEVLRIVIDVPKLFNFTPKALLETLIFFETCNFKYLLHSNLQFFLLTHFSSKKLSPF